MSDNKFSVKITRETTVYSTTGREIILRAGEKEKVYVLKENFSDKTVTLSIKIHPLSTTNRFHFLSYQNLLTFNQNLDPHQQYQEVSPQMTLSPSP